MTTRLKRYRPVRSGGSGLGTSLGRNYEETEGEEPAYRCRLTGRRRMETGEIFAAYDAEFLVYRATPVREFWRVRECGGFGHLYEVSNIIDSGDFVKLQCTKVNE